jgi:hypothetical protein
MPTASERASILRHRIELYRCYLREGGDADKAFDYLREIEEAKAELETIADTEHVSEDN